MTDIASKLIEAGYRYDGRTEAGIKYVRPGYTVYHSGHMLIFRRDGGMTRPFREDRLLFFTIADMERQTSIDPMRFSGKEDLTNYEVTRQIAR